MREVSNEELKAIELNILKEIHNFCEQNGLRYFICGGTLLGAVRHGGFIPWDDDIDLCMPRKDYEKFITRFNNHKNYRVLNFPKAEGYYQPYAKVCDARTLIEEKTAKNTPNCGVFVDIFPLDGLSDDRAKAKRILNSNSTLIKLNTLLALRQPRIVDLKQHWKRVFYFPARLLFSQEQLVKRLDKQSQEYPFDRSKYVGVAFGYYGEREIMSSQFFSSVSSVKFEDTEVYAPGDFDGYLSTLYGDYMKLPPEEKRVSHHSFVAYWLEG